MTESSTELKSLRLTIIRIAINAIKKKVRKKKGYFNFDRARQFIGKVKEYLGELETVINEEDA